MMAAYRSGVSSGGEGHKRRNGQVLSQIGRNHLPPKVGPNPQIIIEPVTEAQARIARDAYRDFGKGQAEFRRLLCLRARKFTSQPLLFMATI